MRYIRLAERDVMWSPILGATFGKTGNPLTRSDGDPEDYANSKFIKDVKNNDVDFVMHSRGTIVQIFNVPKYNERAKMAKIVKDIPIADAIWIGHLLSELSKQQVSDAFRAAGYSNQEVEMFTDVVERRIHYLTSLSAKSGVKVQ